MVINEDGSSQGVVRQQSRKQSGDMQKCTLLHIVPLGYWAAKPVTPDVVAVQRCLAQ